MATFQDDNGKEMVECDFCLAMIPVEESRGCDECETDFCKTCWAKFGPPDKHDCDYPGNWPTIDLNNL